jgi:putative NADH-flavin reductase
LIKKIQIMEREIKSIVVLGGTGRTGIHVVQQALQRGLRVTTLVRDSSKLKGLLDHPELEIVKGDVTNFSDIYNAVQGNDAIISILGRIGKNNAAIIQGTENIIAAVQKSRISKTICLSSFGAGSTRSRSSWLFNLLVRVTGLRASFEAKTQQELLFYKSRIDFTLIMACRLTDDLSIKELSAYPADQLPFIHGIPKKVARTKVATFMLDQLDSRCWSRKTVCLLAEDSKEL